MNGVTGRTVSKHGLAPLAAVACLVVASCSETASPPAATPTTSTAPPRTTTSTVPAPAPITGPLEKDWKSYGGTAYFGCPDKFSVGKSALDNIRPKVFDTKTGQYVAPAIPTIPAGENVTGAQCALTGTADEMRVVYVVTTATKTTAYAYDFTSGQPLVTKELLPPTPELKLTAGNEWGLAPTASGVAWVNAFTDGHVTASPPRTAVLSGTDLSMPWNDPQPGHVWQDVLAFQRNTQPDKTSGAELRRPNGEAIYQDNDIWTVDAELADGPDKLVKMTHWDSYNPPAVSTMFYDLNTKSIIKIGDSDRVSGGGCLVGREIVRLRSGFGQLAVRFRGVESAHATMGAFEDPERCEENVDREVGVLRGPPLHHERRQYVCGPCPAGHRADLDDVVGPALRAAIGLDAGMPR